MSLLDKSCTQFVEVLASKSPVPGGGGAAALGGALGMALSNMVGNLTVGKKKYAEVEDEVKQLIEAGNQIIADMECLVTKDAEAFEPLSRAYGLPRETPEQVKVREETLENCSKLASSVPLEIMRKAFEGIKIHHRMGQIGTLIAISDVGCGVLFLRSALLSAKLNVMINLNTIKDQEYIQTINEEMDQLVSQGCKMADATLELVLGKLSK